MDIEGQSDYQKFLHINGTSVEYNKFLIDENGNPTFSIEFGNMYFGEKKIVESFLVNNTSQAFTFNCKIRIGLHQSDVNFNSFFVYKI